MDIIILLNSMLVVVRDYYSFFQYKLKKIKSLSLQFSGILCIIYLYRRNRFSFFFNEYLPLILEFCIYPIDPCYFQGADVCISHDHNGVQVELTAHVRVNVQTASSSAFVHNRSRQRHTLD